MKTLFILLALSLPLKAQEAACTLDVQKFCGEVKPNSSQETKCLKDHVHELSPDCKDKHTARKEPFKKGLKTGKKDKSEPMSGN